MDENLRQQKIEMWTKKLAILEKELVEIIQRRSEAAREGDLRENAAYQQATEDRDTWTVRIQDIKNILTNLEKNK